MFSVSSLCFSVGCISSHLDWLFLLSVGRVESPFTNLKIFNFLLEPQKSGPSFLLFGGGREGEEEERERSLHVTVEETHEIDTSSLPVPP